MFLSEIANDDLGEFLESDGKFTVLDEVWFALDSLD